MLLCRVHANGVGLQEYACWALKNIAAGEDAGCCARKQAVIEAGALTAIVNGMRHNPDYSGIQEQACGAIRNACYGSDELGIARKQLADDAFVLTHICRALLAHPSIMGLQEQGCGVFAALCTRTDAAGLRRKQRAIDAGVVHVIVRALQVGSGSTGATSGPVTEQACRSVMALCSGSDDGSSRRKQLMVDAGAFEAVAKAMGANRMSSGVGEMGCRAVRAMITGRDADNVRARKRLALESGVLDQAIRALSMHRSTAGVQSHVAKLLSNLGAGKEEGQRCRQMAVEAGAVGAIVSGMVALVDIAKGGGASDSSTKEAGEAMDNLLAVLKLITAQKRGLEDAARRAGLKPEWLTSGWRA